MFISNLRINLPFTRLYLKAEIVVRNGDPYKLIHKGLHNWRIFLLSISPRPAALIRFKEDYVPPTGLRSASPLPLRLRC